MDKINENNKYISLHLPFFIFILFIFVIIVIFIFGLATGIEIGSNIYNNCKII